MKVLDADGNIRWEQPDRSVDGGGTTLVGTAGPWVVASQIGGPDGEEDSTMLFGLANGGLGPTLPGRHFVEFVADDTAFYATSFGTGEGPAILQAVTIPEAGAGDAAAMDVLWSRPVAGDEQLVRSPHELLVVGAAAVEHLDPETGDMLRRTALPSLGMGPTAFADGFIVRRTDVHTLEAIELSSGESWTRTFEAPVTAAPIIAGHMVYLATDGILLGLDLSDGQEVASAQSRAPVTSITVAGGVLLATTSDRVLAFGPAGANVRAGG